jgi:hypothetical protein
LKRSRLNCWAWWRCWANMISTSESSHRNPTGITVLMQKGTTSKEMEENKNVDKWLSLGRWFLGTFG